MRKKINYYRSYLFALLTALAAIFFDQFTKVLAVKNLKNKSSIALIENVFELHYLENRGAAFGMLQNQKLLFIVIGIVILAAVVLCYMKLPHSRRFVPLRICLIFVASGAIGNMIDRIRLDYVIDFLYFELIDFPIFNVADIYVTISAFVLVFLILFYYKEEDLESVFSLFSKRKKEKQEHVS